MQRVQANANTSYSSFLFTDLVPNRRATVVLIESRPQFPLSDRFTGLEFFNSGRVANLSRYLASCIGIFRCGKRFGRRVLPLVNREYRAPISIPRRCARAWQQTMPRRGNDRASNPDYLNQEPVRVGGILIGNQPRITPRTVALRVC